MLDHIFISHTTQDDATVKRLRELLELQGLSTWVDSRDLSGGDILDTRIEENIRAARHFVVVISMAALGSERVQREVHVALDEAGRRTDGYKVIPVVLPGVQRGHLRLLFPDERLYIFLEDGPVGPNLSDKLSDIFAALGMKLPEDWEHAAIIEAAPVEELILKLTDPFIHEKDGVRRAAATAERRPGACDRRLDGSGAVWYQVPTLGRRASIDAAPPPGAARMARATRCGWGRSINPVSPSPSSSRSIGSTARASSCRRPASCGRIAAPASPSTSRRCSPR